MKRLLGLVAGFVTPCLFAAVSAHSVPVGGMSVTINGGSLGAPVTTSFVIPLYDSPQASGAGVGRITSITATTITSTGAGWTPGALATVAFPYVFQIKSGTAVGAIFGIIGNTADTLTTSGVDLTTLGVTAGSSGDAFGIVPVDTLNTLFGSSTLLGGDSPANADIVVLSTTIKLSCYYNTSLGRWVRTTGPTTDRGDVPIPQDSVVSITRKSGALTLRFVGRVPDVRLRMAVRNAGSTYTHTGFPADVTLGALSMQTALAGWVSAPLPANADTLAIGLGSGSLACFYNGTYWQRTTGPATNRDAIVITAGTPIIIFKRGAASGTSWLTRNLPYTP